MSPGQSCTRLSQDHRSEIRARRRDGTQQDRRTVDLSAFPDLVVIYLGMRVNKPRGLKTLLRFGPKIAKSVADQPDGLLLHENMIFSVCLPTACASTGRTSSPWSGGRARCRTRSGGRASCATRGYGVLA